MTLVHFVSALIVSVPEPQKAREFFLDRLGFVVRKEEIDACSLDNGAVAIRLVTAATGPSIPTLEVSAPDPEELAQQLEAAGDLLELGSAKMVSEQRLEVRAVSRHGVALCIVREFDEDDLGLLPELPSNIDWSSEAALEIRELLRQVPIAFRSEARERVTREAEAAALERGRVRVELVDAFAGLFRATPSFKRPWVLDQYARLGLEPPEEGET